MSVRQKKLAVLIPNLNSNNQITKNFKNLQYLYYSIYII